MSIIGTGKTIHLEEGMWVLYQCTSRTETNKIVGLVLCRETSTHPAFILDEELDILLVSREDNCARFLGKARESVVRAENVIFEIVTSARAESMTNSDIIDSMTKTAELFNNLRVEGMLAFR